MEILKDTNRISVIKDGNIVIKKFKNLSDKGNKSLLGKLERIDNVKKIKGLVVPFDYKLKNGIVEEIYTNYIDEPDLSYETNNGKLSFDSICESLSNVDLILKQLHENEILALDFISLGNLKFNKKTNEVYFLDYEDMQVGNNFAFACNQSLRNFLDLKYDKYYDNNRFTFNADIYLLAVFWFKMCTSVQLSNILRSPVNLFSCVNLPNDEEIAKKILLCYDLNDDNKYFDDDFLNMAKFYMLEDNNSDIIRKFKKNNM